VGPASAWGQSPRQSIETECSRRGQSAVVAGCIELLYGRSADPVLVVALGGPPARWAVSDDPDERAGPDYWLRVWAARGLLWAWDDTALPALLTALEDESWRVREMAAKVVARHRVDEALTLIQALRHDPVARLRSAGSRAVVRLVATGT